MRINVFDDTSTPSNTKPFPQNSPESGKSFQRTGPMIVACQWNCWRIKSSVSNSRSFVFDRCNISQTARRRSGTEGLIQPHGQRRTLSASEVRLEHLRRERRAEWKPYQIISNGSSRAGGRGIPANVERNVSFSKSCSCDG